VFSPDPYRRLETVEVLIQTAAGEERVWTFPSGGVVDQFTWYRWHKLKETAVKTPELRAAIAEWVARELLVPSDYPARVSMLLYAEGFLPPDGAAEAPPDVTDVLYAETLVEPP